MKVPKLLKCGCCGKPVDATGYCRLHEWNQKPVPKEESK